MKIIEFQNSWDSESERIVSRNILPDAVVIPETALIRTGTPFFIPEWGENWQAKVYIATKITRLGKSIPTRFAYRYRENSFLAVQFLDETIGSDSTALSVKLGFDNSLMLSDTLDFSKPIEIRKEMIGHHEKKIESSTEIMVKDNENLMDLCISKASQFFTLHTGDIILGGYIKQKLFKVEQETRFIISQGTDMILNHKIK